MRNLKLDVIKISNLPLNENNIVKCINVNNKHFILVDNTVHIVDGENDIVIKTDINTIDWVPMENILYMGDGNAFYCYNVETEDINVINIPDGYVIHEWNPSQDRIVLVNKDNILKIVLLDAYNCYCTYIGKYQLKCVENSPFINIGWGSQTTQFRGSEGKFTKKQNSDEEVTSDNVDSSIRIAWRDDGDIFAVSFVRDGQRLFKIFSCECEFLFESEYKPDLSADLAWKPDGSLIAVESRPTTGCYMTFFEKNGLCRYNFKLYSDKNVAKIQWNSTGDILMIWQKSGNNSEISVWTCSNFKWYLKQNLVFNDTDIVNSVQWKNKKWLEVITSKNIILYSWKWATFINCNEDRQDDIGAVLVIDGNILRVTVTSAGIVPPPNCSYEIPFSNPINYVTFGPTSNMIAVILDNYTLKIIKLYKSKYEEQFSSNISQESLPLTLNNFVFDDKLSNIYCIQSLVDEKSAILKFEMDFTNSQTSLISLYDFTEKVYDILHFYHQENKEYYLGICTKTQIKIHSLDKSTISVPDLSVVQDEILEEGGYYSIFYVDNHLSSLFLNSQRLYFNGAKLANNITSYLFYHNYLLLTTTENKLLCIKLSEEGFNNIQENNLSTIYTRIVPNAALLISAVPKSRKIILQVPRGELEIINPRILAIDEIDKLLSNKKHLEAFLIMRTDRINLNLIYDLNPARFINDIEDFIKNINNCEYLDVFLTQLQDSNISNNLYRNCFENNNNEEVNNKISTIADHFIEKMKKLDVDYYLQSIVTAYLCKGTDDDLEKALKELSAAKEREKNGIKLRTTVDKTLEHLILLSSVEKLYDIALGMDQMELILWVASKSQLDPLDYIPFLRELVSMETNYRNYKINCHIKRYEKAFSFLIECDNVLDELTQLVTKNNLYKVILKYILPTNQWYKPMMNLYATFLNTEGYYKDSGLIYMKINNYETALQCFVKGCCMTEVLIVIELLPPYDFTVKESLKELATKLLDDKQYKNASFLYDEILNNYEQAIDVLIKGCLWSDALYLAYKNKRHDIIESDINPAILNTIEHLSSELKTYHNEFLTLKNRLQVIRDAQIKGMKQKEDIMHHDEFYNTNDYSNINFDTDSVISTTYSKTTSQRTKSSHITSASSKRKKRIEKKVLQIREGSAFENIAIIRRLHIIITQVDDMANSVKDTCLQFMLNSQHYENAIQLRSAYEEILKLIESSREIIWPQEMILPPHPVTIESIVYRLNLQHLEMQYRYPPKEIKNIWKIHSL